MDDGREASTEYQPSVFPYEISRFRGDRILLVLSMMEMLCDSNLV